MRGTRQIAAAGAASALSLVLVGPASAAVKSVHTTDGGTGAGFTATAGFWAYWKASQFHGEGSTVWLIENLEMIGALPNGMACTPDLCTSWSYGFQATFYNSAGTKVATINPTRNNQCYDTTFANTSRVFHACKRYGTEVPITAKTMKLSWSIGVTDRFGISYAAWNTTMTVNLTTT